MPRRTRSSLRARGRDRSIVADAGGVEWQGVAGLHSASQLPQWRCGTRRGGPQGACAAPYHVVLRTRAGRGGSASHARDSARCQEPPPRGRGAWRPRWCRAWCGCRVHRCGGVRHQWQWCDGKLSDARERAGFVGAAGATVARSPGPLQPRLIPSTRAGLVRSHGVRSGAANEWCVHCVCSTGT